MPTIHGPVVQLVRMPACHAGGRGFEPHPDRHTSVFLNRKKAEVKFYYEAKVIKKPACVIYNLYASVAQSVEQGTENPRVGGSIPPGGTTKISGSGSVVERHLAKVNVASSNLVFRSKDKRRIKLRLLS